MSDLINSLVGTLGIDAPKAESAAGAVLGLIQKNAPAGALDGLMKAAPDAAGWVQKAAPLLGDSGGGGGGLGGLAGAAAGMLGGGGGLGGMLQGAAALGAVSSVLGKLGIPADMAAKAIPLVMGFVQTKLGASGFDALVGQVPFLKQLSGGGAGAPAAAGAAGGIGGMIGGLFKG